MHIETLGQGPDLIMIHGWAMHSGIFAPLTRQLATQFRLHLVDLPGHGLSPERSGPLQLDDCAQRLAAQLPRAIWLGWSLGGQVCLRAGLLQPAAVRGLVMIASSPRFVLAEDWPHGVAAEVFRQFGTGLREDYHRTIERFLALEAHGSEKAQSELRELKAHVFDRGEPALHVLCDGLDILDTADLRECVPQLAAPSLWLAGRRDRLIPPAAMQWGAEHSPQGRYREYSAGHAPFIGHAQAMAEAIAEFAAELAA
ncbi:carboxylesterase BioH (pimeloyl-CoA synthesis) [Tahibacter aquaticus]|uniref:Pimeloyl-[acyl-carrier protein] methyl ester esterase n=1 Tax=Tahibacter aquaticus TaxID=520092 RepID=A0A4R6YSW6_9GAMM|nr:pimeloyl-ACP methyl ester esterase BioH [Tahibacter aquaticus]TDR41182.1 carboxylesterase BioH (pimeloyl-CoA synthesis) [Tahibacter aquaticus]